MHPIDQKRELPLFSKNILFVGPVTPPITGQALAFYETYKKIRCRRKFLANQNVTGKHPVSQAVLISRAVSKILSCLLFNRIDIIYFTCSRSRRGCLFDIMLICLSRLFHARLINHLKGADFGTFYESLDRFSKRLVHYCYEKIDISIVPVEGMTEEFSAYFPKMMVKTVPNFYEEALERIQGKTSSKNVRLLYLSNIIKSKGILDLLDSFCALTKRYDDLSLTIAGDFIGDSFMGRNEIKETFLRKIEKLKQNPRCNVSYVGVVSGDDKINLLRDSDIFILPTYFKSELFPFAIIEALRAGNVIITTRHNFLTEIVSEDNGCLIDVKSPRMIESAVARFVEDKERMREVQRYNINYARERYSQELYVKRIVNILENV
jgi:glycosyltransferase involved in cell wall biosynthesis